MINEINWTIFSPPERTRIYVFPDNVSVIFRNVTKLEVRESGKHRLETAQGEKAFVNTGWLYILIDADKWTV